MDRREKQDGERRMDKEGKTGWIRREKQGG